MATDIKKVFIVDDDESICRALKCLLTAFGFVVETFFSGKAFFDAITDTDPGCLILDIHLPGLNGWEVQKRLALVGSKRQIIIITADKNGGLRERSLEAGAVGFLQKPFNDQELINLVNQSFNAGTGGMKKDFLMIFVLLFLTTSLLGCSMFQGSGKDMQDPGLGIQKTLDRDQ